jgi:hypothetical protein
MTQLKNPMDIYRLLDRSNCKECNEKSCMAFAAAVFTGKRKLDECPRLENNSVRLLVEASENRPKIDQDLDEAVAQLKEKIATVDLSLSAQRVGGKHHGGKLTLKVLGKDFSVDSKGSLYSDIHVHPWVTIPILSYVLDCTGMPVSGTWVPFRELKDGKTWYRLFGQRCEKPLKKLADEYTDFFEDMVRLFNGRQEKHYGSDISLVLHPLPKVPILICYWKPEDDLNSNLNVFFDSTANDNLRIESIYALGTGLVRMFRKIALRHGS